MYTITLESHTYSPPLPFTSSDRPGRVHPPQRETRAGRVSANRTRMGAVGWKGDFVGRSDISTHARGGVRWAKLGLR